MSIHSQAGKVALPEMLINIDELISAYYEKNTNLQPVAFGTSGHRGSSFNSSFNEKHILATTKALCEYRIKENISGPLFIGFDSHALSLPAFKTAIAVLAANQVPVFYSKNLDVTPTPVISHAILTYNEKNAISADGIVITPSHNPPQDGGFKYNSIDGGPADVAITSWVQDRANEILNTNTTIEALSYEEALASDFATAYDFITPYVDDLSSVINMEAIAKAGIKIGVDPLGGAGLPYWEPIAKKYGLDIEVVNKELDPTFSFMCVDRDGKIRMDCSSPFAMAGLIDLKDRFDLAFANDPDSDRHGIVCPGSGLMNPNHYLAVCIQYLCQNRDWNANIGKTLVSSSMIDHVVAELGRKVVEVPVGFKWFVGGLVSGELAFGGEESAGASFLRLNGKAWSTDKDGIILNLLAAEIIATTGKNPAEHYAKLEEKFGSPVYERIDAPATPAEKAKLKSLQPSAVTAQTLAGDAIVDRLTEAPGNGASIGGLKVTTKNGWFAARPSGTEDVYKIYAESFVSADHLKLLQKEAQEVVNAALKA